MSGYNDLLVWQRAMELVVVVYELTKNYPKSELFGLISQVRRSAVSIPSNIAEGSKRGSKKEYRQFLIIAYGSGAELETQLEIAKRLDFGDVENYEKANGLLNEVMRMLNVMIKKFKD